MKVLVSTKQRQGERDSDFSFTDESELVRFGSECDSDRDDIDGGCGCRRAMTGFNTLKGTTTFEVVEMPIMLDHYVSLLTQSYKKSGFEIPDSAVHSEALNLLDMAESFPTNAVLEKRGDLLQIRE